MLDKKQIQVIFLFEFKMSQKAGETTHNISNTSGSGTANRCTVQGWFKKFFKGEKSLEDEELSGQPSDVDNGQPSDVDNGQLRASLKLILLKLHKKLPKKSMSTILWSCSLWSKLKRLESSVSECLMSWPQIQRIVTLKCHFLLFYAITMNRLLIGLWCATKKWILYDNQ